MTAANRVLSTDGLCRLSWRICLPFAAGLVLASVLLVPSFLGADEAGPESLPAGDKALNSKASENYYKSGEFIPGEEVVTPTGKKIKVWSTKGPVPVSPPPQPFDDPEQRLDDSQIIVDGAQAPIYRDREGRSESGSITNQTGQGIQPGSSMREIKRALKRNGSVQIPNRSAGEAASGSAESAGAAESGKDTFEIGNQQH